MGSPVVTGEMKRLDRLAHEYGVGVSTPSWSSRITYFYSSVSNGRQIERRIAAVGGGVSNMAELQKKELEYQRTGSKYIWTNAALSMLPGQYASGMA